MASVTIAMVMVVLFVLILACARVAKGQKFAEFVVGMESVTIANEFCHFSKHNLIPLDTILFLWYNNNNTERRMEMYKWGVYNFSEKEIEQIVSLVELWANGSSNPLDCRKYTKQVRRWAENWSLIQKGTEMSQAKWNAEIREWDYPWYVKQWGKDRYYIHSELRLFHPIRYIPQEALWRILAPMIKERKGFSISTLHGWYTLGLEPNGTKYHRDDDLVDMMFALGELSKWGYIIFQHAGSIWQITVTEDKAARSEF